jgi:hypothetical protein
MAKEKTVLTEEKVKGGADSDLLTPSCEMMKSFYDFWGDFASRMMNCTSDIMKDGIDQEKYKRFYGAWMDSISDVTEKMMRTPYFASSVFEFLGKSLEFQKHLDEVIEMSLRNMRIPSISDIQEVREKLTMLEMKIDDMNKRRGGKD